MCSLGTIGKTGANVNEPSNQYILFLELTSSTVVSPKLGMLLALANIYKPDPGMGHRTMVWAWPYGSLQPVLLFSCWIICCNS
jgi:hypothetical protein